MSTERMGHGALMETGEKVGPNFFCNSSFINTEGLNVLMSKGRLHFCGPRR